MKTRSINIWVILITLLVFGSSCKRTTRKPELSSPTSGTVLVYADESFSPVVEPLLEVFNSIYTFADARCQYLPETDIMNALLKFETPMVFASRPLTAEEKNYFTSRNYAPKEFLIGLDAIALIVNPAVPDSLISIDQIRDILTGKIKTWSQLGYQTDKEKIQVVFDHEGSSTVRFMIDSICKGQPFGPGLSALKGNQEVINYIINIFSYFSFFI